MPILCECLQPDIERPERVNIHTMAGSATSSTSKSFMLQPYDDYAGAGTYLKNHRSAAPVPA
jgi:hypothetical protein